MKEWEKWENRRKDLLQIPSEKRQRLRVRIRAWEFPWSHRHYGAFTAITGVEMCFFFSFPFSSFFTFKISFYRCRMDCECYLMLGKCWNEHKNRWWTKEKNEQNACPHKNGRWESVQRIVSNISSKSVLFVLCESVDTISSKQMLIGMSGNW